MIGKIINKADRKVCAIVVALTVVLMNLPVRIAYGRLMLTDIVDFIACIAMAAMIALFAFNGKIPHAKYIVCKLWFVPAAIMVISVIFNCIRDIRYIEGGARILYFLLFLVEIAQYAFVGLWLRYEVSREEVSENRIDDIVVLKKMCDDGVISEEEFTAKKRQILGI